MERPLAPGVWNEMASVNCDVGFHNDARQRLFYCF